LRRPAQYALFPALQTARLCPRQQKLRALCDCDLRAVLCMTIDCYTVITVQLVEKAGSPKKVGGIVALNLSQDNKKKTKGIEDKTNKAK
jgi:hypothetical protein